jgi:hypothetical protein
MAMIAEKNAPISSCHAMFATFAAFSSKCGEFNSALEAERDFRYRKVDVRTSPGIDGNRPLPRL